MMLSLSKFFNHAFHIAVGFDGDHNRFALFINAFVESNNFTITKDGTASFSNSTLKLMMDYAILFDGVLISLADVLIRLIQLVPAYYELF